MLLGSLAYRCLTRQYDGSPFFHRWRGLRRFQVSVVFTNDHFSHALLSPTPTIAPGARAAGPRQARILDAVGGFGIRSDWAGTSVIGDTNGVGSARSERETVRLRTCCRRVGNLATAFRFHSAPHMTATECGENVEKPSR